MTATAIARGWPQNPAAGVGGLNAPVAGSTSAPGRASSWPLRDTCGQLVSRLGPGLTFSACVLSPGHRASCLPAPGMPA